jgi:pSer/pThr/pTyr-binding forkhead associated (FHA) protein
MSGPSGDDPTISTPSADPLARFAAKPAELKRLLEAERAGVPFLAFRDAAGALALTLLEPGAGRVLTIGRRDGADVAIVWDAEVSGLHAELEEIGGVWTISDDGLSTNGTYVNSQRVAGRRRLAGGDRIRVGRTIIAFNTAEGAPVAKTVVAGRDAGAHPVTAAQKRVLVALCRPYFAAGASFAAPPTNQQIATEIFLGVDAVKMHLRALFASFGLNDLPQNQKRAKLAETAVHFGIVSAADLER